MAARSEQGAIVPFIRRTLITVLCLSLLGLTPAFAATATVFDDMEHGDPFGNGWFAFPGSVGGGGIGPNGVDLPPETAGAYSLETGWGSGGTPGFFGGFGRTFPTDLSGTAFFTFWINPDAGQDYTLEINLQEDDNSDGAISPPDDDEFQFNCVITPSGPCAVSGGGWQLISIPLSSFFYDSSYLFGGNRVLDAAPAGSGGNGELINVVVAVIGNTGSDATFRTDDWTFSELPAGPRVIVDDFESPLVFLAKDSDGNEIGFSFFQGADSTVSLQATSTVPAPVPGSLASNKVLRMDADVSTYAGFIHAFENAALDTWVTQDWSASKGLGLWMYGSGTGTELFIDVLDNRNPGSTTDDAERWTVTFMDDFSGWAFFEFPFADFVRKEVGNGAPNDGFGLTEVHGWAFGSLATDGPNVYYMDTVHVYGVAEIPELAVGFAGAEFDIAEGATGSVTVKLNREMNEEDPAEVSVDYAMEVGSATPDRDYIASSGTLTFVNGGDTELSFPLETLADAKWEGTERVILRLSDFVDVNAGASQAAGNIIDDDLFDPLLVDDFERGLGLWDASDGVDLTNPEIPDSGADAVPGQGAFEHVLAATVLGADNIEVLGRVCNKGSGVIPVRINSTPDFDATLIDHATVRLGDAGEVHVDRKTGEPIRHQAGDDLLFHFRFVDTGLPCDPDVVPLTGLTFDGEPITGQVWRDFPIGQDWSFSPGLTFWYHGSGTGDNLTVTLKDNRAPDPGPSGWELVWADEFSDPAGTSPNPDKWGYEIGDGVVNGIPGWGNDELQYYTNSPDNVATDGEGNLVITAQEADGSYACYYGTCDYTSARLVTKDLAEFAYGRIESRIQVPDGAAGLWPAFWSLGTDIDLVGWPQTGEIDFMEYVSRLPNEFFGTIHGPGYSGGQSYGDVYDFGVPVSDEYHTFVTEWEPDLIKWYVDDTLYHTATPEDVAPNQWVFNDPVYLLLNMALGGNFGGALSDDLVFPQEMKVDYVRVFQGPDTAERFEASFVDDTAGWVEVTVPFEEFTRSASQPDGAPDDGLGLTEVWGYGFATSGLGSTNGFMVDQVRLEPKTEVATTAADSGPGSVRQAIADAGPGGVVLIDPSLAGATVNLTSGPLVTPDSVMIDGSGAPGFAIDGGGSDRVLIVAAGAVVEVTGVMLANGYGWQLAGCVLNNGDLTLANVTVSGCVMGTDAGDFWQGGGGIYTGDGGALTLIGSSVTANAAAWSGGGIYSFFNTTTVIDGSVIANNVSNDVGGGLRLLGNATITDSTISGNQSTGWYGGAAFITDGTVDMSNVTIVDNVSPDYAPAAVFVGTFGPSSATLNLQDSVVANNLFEGCFLAPFGAGPVAINSLGGNVFTDYTCFPGPDDEVVAEWP
jgi:beta-glucanase (GH16 family)